MSSLSYSLASRVGDFSDKASNFDLINSASDSAWVHSQADRDGNNILDSRNIMNRQTTGSTNLLSWGRIVVILAVIAVATFSNFYGEHLIGFIRKELAQSSLDDKGQAAIEVLRSEVQQVKKDNIYDISKLSDMIHGQFEESERKLEKELKGVLADKTKNLQIQEKHEKELKGVLAKLGSIQQKLSTDDISKKGANIAVEEQMSLVKSQINDIKNHIESNTEKTHSLSSKLNGFDDRLAQFSSRPVNTNSDSITEHDIRRILLEVLEGDTPAADFALGSNGAKILYAEPSFASWIDLQFRATPSTAMISPVLTSGTCFSFKGTNGTVIIQLRGFIRPLKFSYEHAILSPIKQTAPRFFRVMGASSSESKELGIHNPDVWHSLHSDRFEYKLENQELNRVQGFLLSIPKSTESPKQIPTMIDQIKIVIEDNHGFENYTCAYRFRIHGIPSDSCV